MCYTHRYSADANDLTDEDSADSESEETYIPQRLPANLLLAPAELRDNRGHTCEEHEDSDDDMPLSNVIKTKPVKYSFTSENNFANTDMVPIFPEPNFSKLGIFPQESSLNYLLMMELLNLLFFNQICIEVQIILLNCRLITKEELKTFIAILIVSSYDR